MCDGPAEGLNGSCAASMCPAAWTIGVVLLSRWDLLIAANVPISVE